MCFSSRAVSPSFCLQCRAVSSKDLARIWYEHIFPVAGVPLTIVSDRGPQFIAELFTSFMAALGVDSRFSTPGHAQTDGASERAVQSVRHMLRALSMSAGSLHVWKAMLPRAVFSYNSTPHSTTGRAPFYMAMLRVPRSFLTINNSTPAWSEDDTRQFLDALYKDNTDAIVRAGARHARYHDRRRHPFPTLKEGDMVMVRKAALGSYFAAMSGVADAASKLKSLPQWQGPFHPLSQRVRRRSPARNAGAPPHQRQELAPCRRPGLRQAATSRREPRGRGIRRQEHR